MKTVNLVSTGSLYSGNCSRTTRVHYNVIIPARHGTHCPHHPPRLQLRCHHHPPHVTLGGDAFFRVFDSLQPNALSGKIGCAIKDEWPLSDIKLFATGNQSDSTACGLHCLHTACMCALAGLAIKDVSGTQSPNTHIYVHIIHTNTHTHSWVSNPT